MSDRISTRQELSAFIYRLLDDKDAIEVENASAYAFLEALAAWLHEASRTEAAGAPPAAQAAPAADQPSWQLFADALQAARSGDLIPAYGSRRTERPGASGPTAPPPIPLRAAASRSAGSPHQRRRRPG